MIKIEFTGEEKQAVEYERYNYPHPRVPRKMEALWLKSLGMSHKEICRVTGFSPNTLRSYLRAYQRGGIEALKRLKFYHSSSEMSQHRTTIEEYFREHPPASVKEAMAKIEEIWISLNASGNLLRNSASIRNIIPGLRISKKPSPTAWTRRIPPTNKNLTLYSHCGFRVLKKLNLCGCEV